MDFLALVQSIADPESASERRTNCMKKGLSMNVDCLRTRIVFPDLHNKDIREIGVMKPCLSQNLKRLLEGRGLSAKSLAKEIGVPPSTISSYLAGKKATYSPEHLAAISQYFEVTVDYLLFGKGLDVPSLNTIQTEDIFEGWLKVKIERAIPSKSLKKDKG